MTNLQQYIIEILCFDTSVKPLRVYYGTENTESLVFPSKISSVDQNVSKGKNLRKDMKSKKDVSCTEGLTIVVELGEET